jgi:glutaminyl-peptide cyclotransferase
MCLLFSEAYSVTGKRIVLPSLLLFIAIACVACSHDKEDSTAKAQNPPAGAAETSNLNLPPDSGPLPTFDSARAMKYVKEIVAFGPRPIGSANHKKVEEYIVSHLKGDSVEDDIFTADTPEGKFPVRNTSYVGANDGASSSALLLEIADQLRGKKLEGYSVWLVWDDAEEAMKAWTDADSLYGIRHLAQKWQDDGTLKKIKAFLLADMIGDADLNIDRDLNSTPWLEEVVYQAATRLGDQSHFYARENQVSDDHIPFMQRGVPCADLIDFDYGYNNVFWHTPQDTVDKLSPKSLEIVGGTVLETIRILDKMDPLPPK